MYIVDFGIRAMVKVTCGFTDWIYPEDVEWELCWFSRVKYGSYVILYNTIFKTKTTTIKEGELANLTLFNPDCKSTFNEEKIYSTSKNSAFLGKELAGKVYGVFAKNKLVINE